MLQIKETYTNVIWNLVRHRITMELNKIGLALHHSYSRKSARCERGLTRCIASNSAFIFRRVGEDS